MFYALLILSYLLGAIPVGYILTRLLKRIDIRQYGSGNVGATNVYRVVGPVAGIAVLALDIVKGVIPVTVFGDYLLRSLPEFDPLLVRLLFGLAAVCGHNWTIFLQFKGGKGVATTAGALVGLSFKIPQLGLVAGLSLGIWLVVLFSTGYVSLASIVACLALPILVIIFDQPGKLLIFTIALCLFVIYRHKSNIHRMLRGEEGKIFRR